MLNTTRRRGFTLVELAITGAIMAGLVAFLVIYVTGSRDSVLDGRDQMTQVLNEQLDATTGFRVPCPSGFTTEELEAANVICAPATTSVG